MRACRAVALLLTASSVLLDRAGLLVGGVIFFFFLAARPLQHLQHALNRSFSATEASIRFVLLAELLKRTPGTGLSLIHHEKSKLWREVIRKDLFSAPP